MNRLCLVVDFYFQAINDQHTSNRSLLTKNNDDNANENDDVHRRNARDFVSSINDEQFEAFASEQPLDTLKMHSLTMEIDDEFDRSSNEDNGRQEIVVVDKQSIEQDSARFNDQPWELEESDEDIGAPLFASSLENIDAQSNNQLSSERSALPVSLSSSSFMPTIDSDDGDDEQDEHEQENYDSYFPKQSSINKNTNTVEVVTPKNVRFNETTEEVIVHVPKDSLDGTSSDSDALDVDNDDDELAFPTLSTLNDRISDHLKIDSGNNDGTIEMQLDKTRAQPDSEISLTESDDLPPPLPPLPPLHNKKSNPSSFESSRS
jgi:hypothetical protein